MCGLLFNRFLQALQDYDITAVLGEGAFAHVVRGVHKDTGQAIALKLIAVDAAGSLDDVERDPIVMAEARIHLSLSSEPSIVPCLDPPGPFKAVFRATDGSGTVRHLAVLPMPVASTNVLHWLLQHQPVSMAGRRMQNEGSGVAVPMPMLLAGS